MDKCCRITITMKGGRCYSGSEIGASIWEERYVASANSIPSLLMRPWVIGSASPTMHWSQRSMLACTLSGQPLLQSHVRVPLIQISTDSVSQINCGTDLVATANVEELLALMVKVVSPQYIPKLHDKGNTDFQLRRGFLGISM